ncbi:MAG: hypothetical protein HY293_21245, partial [Planctomycetes bacterium]|nr:hypothetical protein [Planctomycetota bacterium]
YLKIDDEIIFYTARSTGGVGGGIPPSTDKFTGCQRGQLGTTGAIHRSGARVELWSVAVSNTANYPSPTIVQIGDEWIGPVQRDPSGKNFWVSFVKPGGQPVRLSRNILGSLPQNHSAADKIIPTFLCRDVNNWPSRGHSVGAGDRVTLTDAANQKAVARVQRAGPLAPPGQFPSWPGNWQVNGATQMAALTDFVTRDWVADDLHVRLLKFPSGEMLSRAWLDTASPQVTIGPIAGQIDELKAFAATKGRVRLGLRTGTSDTTMTVNQVNFPFAQFGGLLKLGDEYVGYGSWTQNATQGSISEMKRGWLNSTQEIHDQGDNAFYLPWIPVSALASDVAIDEKTIRLRQRLSGDPNRYKNGYILLDNEMLLFEWNAGNGQTLSMPAKWDGSTGLYRGMFGTQPATHASGTSLAYGMPFRTWDTYKLREFDNTMVYFQWTVKMDLAHWNSVRWTQDIPTQDKNIVVHAIVRIDGKGEFWDPPGMNDNVMVIDSITGGSNVKVDRTGHQNDAGQFDVRFYVEYKPGSFDAQAPRTAESWKRCPRIKEIQVEYDRPTQTLHHEDR